MKKQEEEQEQQHTSSSWPVIIRTLSDIITINFSLYFKRLKLHGTHCICTTQQLYKKYNTQSQKDMHHYI